MEISMEHMHTDVWVEVVKWFIPIEHNLSLTYPVLFTVMNSSFPS